MIVIKESVRLKDFIVLMSLNYLMECSSLCSDTTVGVFVDIV